MFTVQRFSLPECIVRVLNVRSGQYHSKLLQAGVSLGKYPWQQDLPRGFKLLRQRMVFHSLTKGSCWTFPNGNVRVLNMFGLGLGLGPIQTQIICSKHVHWCCVVLCCLVSSCLVSSYLVLSCLVLSGLVSYCLVFYFFPISLY